MLNSSKKIVALLGPTNTGKTHDAIEKMLEFESGIFGFPLRLLAREVYEKCVTISLEIKFITAAFLNQKLTGKIKIQKKTKSLIFMTCEISNLEDIVVTASGVMKIL